jgi:nitrite reductase (NO-forming)
MAFPGLKKSDERKSVIAYLATASGLKETTAAAPAQPPGQPQAAAPAQTAAQPDAQAPQQTAQATPHETQPPSAQSSASYIPDVRYTLRSGIAEGRMVFLGVGGTIDTQVNPVLSAAEGQVVQITLLNGEGAEQQYSGSSACRHAGPIRCYTPTGDNCASLTHQRRIDARPPL